MSPVSWANHVVYSLRDTFQGLRNTLQSELSTVIPSDRITIAFQDQIGQESPHRDFPCATVYMYDVTFPSSRQIGAHPDIVTDVTATHAVKKRRPMPVDLHFQIDFYSEKLDDNWQILQLAVPLLASRRTKVTTPQGREFYILPTSLEPLDDLTGDGLYRYAFRVYLRAYFEHHRDAWNQYLVLQRRLAMEGVTWTMDEAPE